MRVGGRVVDRFSLEHRRCWCWKLNIFFLGEWLCIWQAPLPTCLDDQSVCGYVQVNPFGINKVAICRCPSEGSAGRGGGRVDCPLDMKMDSSTVRHGNDLYKVTGHRADWLALARAIWFHSDCYGFFSISVVLQAKAPIESMQARPDCVHHLWREWPGDGRYVDGCATSAVPVSSRSFVGVQQ